MRVMKQWRRLASLMLVLALCLSTVSVSADTEGSGDTGQDIVSAEADIDVVSPHDDPPGGTDDDVDIVSAEVTIQVVNPVVQNPSLTVTKTASKSSVKPGETVVFTITATNNGNTKLSSVSVQDVLDSRLVFDSYQIDTGAVQSVQPTGGSYAIGDMNPGDAVKVTITTHVADNAAVGTLTNTVIGNTPDVPTPPEDEVVITIVDQNPHMTVSKTASKSSVKPGETVIFTITATNDGNQALSDVKVTDVLDNRLVFDSYQIDDGTAQTTQPAGGVYTFGSMAIGAIKKLVITAHVKDDATAGTLKNTAVSSTPDLPNPPEDDVVITVAEQNPHLTVSKAANKSTAKRGETVIFTITLTNDGDTALSGVSVTDVLDSRLVFDSYQIDGGAVNTTRPAGGSYSIGNMAVNAVVRLTITTHVASDAAKGTLSNTAVVTSPDLPTPPEDDVTIEIVDPDPPPPTPNPHLKVVKTASKTKAKPGETVAFTITVTNDGNTSLSNVSVTDVLDSRLVFDSWKLDNGDAQTTQPTGGTYAIGNMAVGAIAKLVITTHVKDDATAGSLSNTVVTSTPDIPTPPGDEVIIEIEEDDHPSLRVVKTANKSQAKPGEAVVFTITVTNNGDTKLSNVEVVDTLDSRFVFDSWKLGEGAVQTTQPAGGSYTIGDMEPGDVAKVTINVHIKDSASADVVKNTAIAKHDGDPEGTPGETEVEIVIPVTPPASNPSLKVVKTANKSKVNPGDQVIYTITVTNDGNVKLSDVKVTDVLDSRLVFDSWQFGSTVSATPPSGGSYTIGDMNPGNVAKLYITAHVKSDATSGRMSNVATASSPDLPGPGPDDEVVVEIEIPVTPPVSSPSLKVVKTANKTTVRPNEELKYTISVSNSGNATAKNVVVEDVLDSRLQFVSYSVNGGAVGTTQPAGGKYSIGDVKAGETVKLVITVKVASGVSAGRVTNTAIVGGKKDEVTVDIEVPVTPPTTPTPSLRVDKIASKASVKAGEEFKFTITVTNRGDGTATGVVVEDVLDSRLNFVSYSINGGAEVGSKPANDRYDIGTVKPGTATKLVITVKAADDTARGTIKNVAKVIGGPSDETTVIVEETPHEPVHNPSLSIVKTSDKARVMVGDSIRYTVTVRNSGDAVAENVTVVDVLSSKLEYSGHSINGVAYSTMPVGGRYSVGNINPGESATLVIDVKAIGSGLVKNVATVGDISDEVEVEIGEPEVIIPELHPALSITKTANKKEVLAGSEIRYTITVTNTGDGVAKDVTVFDELDSMTKFVSYSVNGGATVKAQPEDNLYSVGDISANGGTATLVIVVKVSETAPVDYVIYNRAIAYCPDTGNDPVAYVEVVVVDGPPKTGDILNGNAWLEAGFISIAGAFMAAIIGRGRRKKDEE